MMVIKSALQLRAGDMVWKRGHERNKYAIHMKCTSTNRGHDHPCVIVKSYDGFSAHFNGYYIDTGEWLCDRSPCMFRGDT